MQLYFNSFDFATISMSQTDFVTYLGRLNIPGSELITCSTHLQSPIGNRF